VFLFIVRDLKNLTKYREISGRPCLLAFWRFPIHVGDQLPILLQFGLAPAADVEHVMGATNDPRPSWQLKPSQLLWKLSDAARHFKERRQLAHEAALGKRGEDLAHRYLSAAGFKVVARNYRPGPDSEIDIVAKDGDVTVFVEVKSRSNSEYGAPDRAIDIEKRRHILRAARTYAIRAGINWAKVRFDTVAIVFSQPPSIVHQQDVFFEGRAI
jgi:putative endonuclease